MASSLEEVSGTPGNEPSAGAPPTDHFGVFKDFDFLEYESESIEVRIQINYTINIIRLQNAPFFINIYKLFYFIPPLNYIILSKGGHYKAWVNSLF